MVALPTVSEAQIYGNPAKVVRFNTPEPTSRDLIKIRVNDEESAPPAAVPVPAPETAAPASTVVESPVPAPATVATQVRKKPRVIVLSTGPYLPVTGALPLRFSSSRDWPPPLPVPEQPGAETEPTTVAATPPPTEETPVAATPQVAITAPVLATVPATEKPAARPESSVLTADMVLGFLGNLPATEATRGVRFEPAMPHGPTASPAGSSASP